MKPRTKLQRKILELSHKLSPLSDYQHNEAIKKVAPHIAKYNSKNEYVCLDCGHTWKGDEKATVICPHCSAKLEVDKTRKRKYCAADYFAVVTKRNGYQVVRMFYMQTNLRKGKKASYWVQEAFQRWLTPEAKEIIVGRSRHGLCYYADTWDWGSEMEIRSYHNVYSISPYQVIGQSSVISKIKRNGYNGDFHQSSPFTLFQRLLTCNKTETAWKMGQYKLVKHSLGYKYEFEKHWKSIKVAIRHKYIIQDPSMWFDLLEALDYCNKDLLNPKYICPENLSQAHDEWVEKKRAKQRAEEERQQRERLMSARERYLANCKTDEANYKNLKSNFFELEFADQEIIVKPLTTVLEFFEEGEYMHHCVYTNRYFDKKDVLILHAMIDGVSIATIELSLVNFTILQCRGKYNQTPPEYDRIVALIQSNIPKIISKAA